MKKVIQQGSGPYTAEAARNYTYAPDTFYRMRCPGCYSTVEFQREDLDIKVDGTWVSWSGNLTRFRPIGDIIQPFESVIDYKCRAVLLCPVCGKEIVALEIPRTAETSKNYILSCYSSYLKGLLEPYRVKTSAEIAEQKRIEKEELREQKHAEKVQRKWERWARRRGGSYSGDNHDGYDDDDDGISVSIDISIE